MSFVRDLASFAGLNDQVAQTAISLTLWIVALAQLGWLVTRWRPGELTACCAKCCRRCRRRQGGAPSPTATPTRGAPKHTTEIVVVSPTSPTTGDTAVAADLLPAAASAASPVATQPASPPVDAPATPPKPHRPAQLVPDAAIILGVQFVVHITTFVLGESRSSFRVVLPAQLEPNVTLVNISGLTAIAWWRWIEWLLVCPAIIRMLTGLQQKVERRLSSSAATFAWSSETLHRAGAFAVQVMLTAGLSASLYGASTGTRAFSFVVSLLAACILGAAMLASLFRTAVLGPAGLRAPITLLFGLWSLTWLIYAVLWMSSGEGFGASSYGLTALGYGIVDLAGKNALIVLVYRLADRIDDQEALWTPLGVEMAVQTDDVDDDPTATPAAITASPALVPTDPPRAVEEAALVMPAPALRSSSIGAGIGAAKVDARRPSITTTADRDANEGGGRTARRSLPPLPPQPRISSSSASAAAAAAATLLAPAPAPARAPSAIPVDHAPPGAIASNVGSGGSGALMTAAPRQAPPEELVIDGHADPPPPAPAPTPARVMTPEPVAAPADAVVGLSSPKSAPPLELPATTATGERAVTPTPSTARSGGGASETSDADAVEAAVRREMVEALRRRAASRGVKPGAKGRAGAPGGGLSDLFSDGELKEWNRRLNAAATAKRASGVGASPVGHDVGVGATSTRRLPPLGTTSTNAFGRPGYDPALPVYERLYGDAVARMARLEELVKQAQMMLDEDGGAGAGGISPASPGLSATASMRISSPPPITATAVAPAPSPAAQGGTGSRLSSAGAASLAPLSTAAAVAAAAAAPASSPPTGRLAAPSGRALPSVPSVYGGMRVAPSASRMTAADTGTGPRPPSGVGGARG